MLRSGLMVLVSVLSLMASTEISGPEAGAVFDAPTRSVRRVVGFIGNAYLGKSLVGDLDWASLSPSTPVGLAARGNEIFAVSGLNREIPVLAPLDLPAGARALAWSRDGGASLVALAGAEVAYRVRWEATGEVKIQTLALPMAGRITTAALADNGTAVVAIDNQSKLSLWSLTAQGPTPIEGPAQISGLAIASDGNGVFGYDAERAQPFVVRLNASGASLEWISIPAREGASRQVSSLVVAPGGRKLFALQPGLAQMLIWDLDSNEESYSDLEALSDRFESSPFGGHYLLASKRATGDPMYFLNSENGMILFVPAGAN